MTKNYFRTFALGSIAALAVVCIGGGSAYAQQKTIILIPQPAPPDPGSVTGTDPVPPPPPHFVVSKTVSL